MHSSAAYRAQPLNAQRPREAISRMKRAFCPNGPDPMLDAISCDIPLFRSAFPQVLQKMAGLITDWYKPYLLKEIREAGSYEEALPPASLLAFSQKLHCVESLGGLLSSRRPLDVLVSVEALGDMIAVAPPGPVRESAIEMLSRSGLAVAMDELETALMSSPYGRDKPREPPLPPLPIMPYGSIFYPMR
jgi:hypothetical protein